MFSLALRCALVSLLVSSGCAGAKYGASIRTSQGGATAPPGVSTGTTNSIRISDAGGPLSRAFLVGLSLLGAAGSISNVRTTRDVSRSGKQVTVRETTTATVNVANAQAAANLANYAVSSQPVPLSASLEIASRDLGGDTSGWLYQVGYTSRPLPISRFLAGTVTFGLGFGRFTYHERAKNELMAGVDQAREGDYDYKYFGTPIRWTLFHSRFLRTYFQADLNWITLWDMTSFDPLSPSPWRTGVRANVGPLHVQGELGFSHMTREDSSIALEVGFGF